MSSQPKKAPIGYIITVGFAIFATYFGAGNLIFPPTLGIAAGVKWIAVLLGFVVADAGLAVLGIIATTTAGGGVDDMARPIAKWFAVLLGSLICLFIGPLFAVPRVSATTYEIAIQPNIGSIPMWAFSFVFFAITLALTIKQLKVVDIIGKILTPVLIVMLAIIIIGAVAHPVGAPIDTGATGQFGHGFLEGYQTMDAIGSLVMAGIFVFDVRERGYQSKRDQLAVIVPAGVVAFICMAVVYGGLTYVGATVSGLEGFQGLERTQLLVKSVYAILGSTGTIALGIAVAAACLTTSIGLCSMVANFFARVSNGRLNYKINVIIICIVSWLMSLNGVEKIIMLAVNCLLIIYPVVIALIVLNICDRFIPYKWAYRGAILGAFLWSVLDVAKTYDKGLEPIALMMPLDSAGFGWIIPAVVLGIIAALIQMAIKAPNPTIPHRPDFDD